MAETNGNGSNGVFNGLPVWVRIAAFLGVPTFFATVLLTFVIKLAGGQLGAIYNAQLEARTTAVTAATTAAETRGEIHDFLLEHRDEVDVMKQILSEMCAQGAAQSGRPMGNCFPKKPAIPKEPAWRK